MLVLLAARELDRPVKWVAERAADAFLSDSHGRDQINNVELALDGDGRFLALRVNNRANMGAYLSNFAPYIPTDCSILMNNGVYRFQAIHVSVTGVFTNTVPVDAYRGAGRPEAIYLVERTVDVAARQLGIDPAELRRRNFIGADEMPFTTTIGATYDSGDFIRNLDGALKLSESDGANDAPDMRAAPSFFLRFGLRFRRDDLGTFEANTKLKIFFNITCHRHLLLLKHPDKA